jgi:FKBP-type peptidyl-prolyl cis-trans isomerase FklB
MSLVKKIIPALLFSVFFSATHAATKSTPAPLNDNDKINYSIGYKIGRDLMRQKIEIRKNTLIKGVEDAIKGESLLTDRQRRQSLIILQQRAVQAQQNARKHLAKINLKKGKDFLQANATKKGITILPDGLQYRVIKTGTGQRPGVADSVTVNYRGMLIDGTEFDNSFKRNQPVTFKVNRVIQGWSEALQLMHEGAKWELYIPPQLAYGERGIGNTIPPNSTLIFELELLSAGSH